MSSCITYTFNNAKSGLGLFNIRKITDSKDTHQQKLKKLSETWKKWNSTVINPIFLGLHEGKKYNKLHSNRFNNKKITLKGTKK
ncbi:MAG: hypothetical protein ACWIPJ_00205 [Polaribacter sp.]